MYPSNDKGDTLCACGSDLCPPLLKFDAATWRCVAFAERVATAEMYFQASKELLSVWKKTLARRRALPDRPTFAKQDEDWCWQALLTSTERLLVNEIRNENLKEIADIEAQMKSLDPFDPERQEYENTIAGKHRWLVNVSQSKGFQPKCSNHRLLIMPALLRSAKFFIDGENVSESRLVHPLELMAMQSLPVLLPQTLQDLHGCEFRICSISCQRSCTEFNRIGRKWNACEQCWKNIDVWLGGHHVRLYCCDIPLCSLLAKILALEKSFAFDCTVCIPLHDHDPMMFSSKPKAGSTFQSFLFV